MTKASKYKTQNGKAVNPAVFFRRFSFRWWQAAAAIAVLYGTIWLLKPSSDPADLYARYRKFPEASFTQMGEPQQSALPQAAKAFNQKDYAAALQIFKNYLAKDPQNKEIQFFGGLCLMETGREDQAATVFEGLMSPENARSEEAQWYQALCYLKMRNIKVCVALLDLIQIQPEHQHYADARKLFIQLTK